MRNRGLARVAAAWLLFLLAEYAVWIGMLVYAYARSGAFVAGVVAVAELVPGIVIGPLVSTIADRRSPVVLLVWGYVVQTLGMAITAAVLYADGPALSAYAGAVLASTAVTATRPAQAVLLPGLARSPDELTVANAMFNWLDTVAIVLSGTMAGLALSSGHVGLVFAIGAGCTAVAAVLPLGLHARALSLDESDDADGSLALVREGLGVLRARREARVLVSVITAEYIVIGALDLLFVVVAVSQLHDSQAWAGYLNTAHGIGGLGAVAITMALLGRSLGPPLLGASGLLCIAIALVAFTHSTALTLVLMAAAGLGRAVLDTAAQTLLQRTVPADLLGRVFGLVEATTSIGLTIGSLLVPLLVHLGGVRAAVLGTAAVVPVFALFSGRAIMSLDSAAHVPIVQIALLRSMPHFSALPAPQLEGLAQAAERRSFTSGQTIIRQGEPGTEFYAIAEGTVDVSVDGQHVRTCGRPEGFGEIALLRNEPRSATVVANGPVVLYALDGETFMTVVTGHDATHRHSEGIADERLGRPVAG